MTCTNWTETWRKSVWLNFAYFSSIPIRINIDYSLMSKYNRLCNSRTASGIIMYQSVILKAQPYKIGFILQCMSPIPHNSAIVLTVQWRIQKGEGGCPSLEKQLLKNCVLNHEKHSLRDSHRCFCQEFFFCTRPCVKLRIRYCGVLN